MDDLRQLTTKGLLLMAMGFTLASTAPATHQQGKQPAFKDPMLSPQDFTPVSPSHIKQTKNETIFFYSVPNKWQVEVRFHKFSNNTELGKAANAELLKEATQQYNYNVAREKYSFQNDGPEDTDHRSTYLLTINPEINRPDLITYVETITLKEGFTEPPFKIYGAIGKVNGTFKKLQLEDLFHPGTNLIPQLTGEATSDEEPKIVLQRFNDRLHITAKGLVFDFTDADSKQVITLPYNALKDVNSTGPLSGFFTKKP